MGAFIDGWRDNREGVSPSEEGEATAGDCQIQLLGNGPYKLIMDLHGREKHCCTFMGIMLCTKRL
jgi:hypothetical protein